MLSHQSRIAAAKEVLQGLSVGDALGESLGYGYDLVRDRVTPEELPFESAIYTDDTEMALGILEVLTHLELIDQNILVEVFAQRFQNDPIRGYGPMARRLLQDYSFGGNWRELAKQAFHGGSYGNGGAMRSAPIGAYFHDDLERTASEAIKSAEVTHAHPDGIAGAVAIAIATAVAYKNRDQSPEAIPPLIWEAVLQHTEMGRSTWSSLANAAEGEFESTEAAARELGNGSQVAAFDTVPFCVWNACRCLTDFPEALISTVEVGGDCDTNAAIVCAIVTAYQGEKVIPKKWLAVRENLEWNALL